MTLCVTFDALIKAVSDARDNYEWLNNGDGASESRRGGGTKEGTGMAGEQQRSRTSWSDFTEDHIFCALFMSTRNTDTRAKSGTAPGARCS